MKGRWSDVPGVCFQRITHLGTAMEDKSVTLREILPSLSLLGMEELTVGLKEDPGMVSRWSAL